MKLKYYLRGLGMGIIVTAVILALANPRQEVSMNDEAIIEKAKQLGMIMDTESEMVESEIKETETSENEIKQEQIPETEEVLPIVKEQNNQDDETNSTNQTDSGVQNENPEIVEITITPGEYCRGVSEDLFSKGLVDDAEAFRKYMYEIKYDQLIRQGIYQIPKGASYEEIADILISDNE